MQLLVNGALHIQGISSSNDRLNCDNCDEGDCEPLAWSQSLGGRVCRVGMECTSTSCQCEVYQCHNNCCHHFNTWPHLFLYYCPKAGISTYKQWPLPKSLEDTTIEHACIKCSNTVACSQAHSLHCICNIEAWNRTWEWRKILFKCTYLIRKLCMVPA